MNSKLSLLIFLSLYGNLTHSMNLDTPSAIKNVDGETLLKSITPLMRAVLNDNEEQVQALLKDKEQVKTIDQTDATGKTALHYATILQRVNITNHLVNARACCNVSDVCGFTPLANATFNGSSTLIYLLINGGAHVDGKISTGATPLNIAAMLNNPELVEILLQNGADKNITSNIGYRPIDNTRSIMEALRMIIFTEMTERSKQQNKIPNSQEIQACYEFSKTHAIWKLLATPAKEVLAKPTPALVVKFKPPRAEQLMQKLLQENQARLDKNTRIV